MKQMAERAALIEFLEELGFKVIETQTGRQYNHPDGTTVAFNVEGRVQIVLLNGEEFMGQDISLNDIIEIVETR